MILTTILNKNHFLFILILFSIILSGCATSGDTTEQEVHLFNKFKQSYEGSKVEFLGSPVYNENDSHYYIYEEEGENVYVTQLRLPPSHKNLYCDYCKMKGILKYDNESEIHYLDVETVLFRERTGR